MKWATVFKRVILFRLLHSAYSYHSLLLLLFGALVIFPCWRLIGAKVLHQRFHLIPDLRRFLGVMLLGVVEVPAATTMKLAAILLLKIFLRGSSYWAVLWGMMVKFHSHALQLACFLREPLMFFPEFMLIALFGIFPLLGSSVQCGSILRRGLSVLITWLTAKVKCGHSKLFLLSSESQRECFLI